ncbi:XkdX family protein [Clostridium vitabionis]|uniref:XkdX family protein n=1 Tax=Clostridium vitabionis TaxID=2784388 RepID=UPI00188B4D22|nr:XkdX family protein [Clostridium vitabionis]
MEHSKYFEKVKRYYDMGLWSITRVKNAVTHPTKNPWITEAEFKEITGEDYTE